MMSSDSRYVLVFNGEIYNFATLRRELESRGHRFRGRSDTEVILAAVVQWGIDAAVRRLQGMFACALWDTRERELWLFRDRLGIKPLYYGETGAGFAFASELKALAAIPSFRPELSQQAISQYFLAGYIPAPLSIYSGIFKLEPGHLLHLSPARGAAKTSTYWSLPEAVARAEVRPYTGGDTQEATAELEVRLRRAVTRHMIADVPLGVFLSGGLDSSLVAAMTQEHSPGPIQTFSIGFEAAAYDEAPFARKVAEYIGAQHSELYIRPQEAMAVIPELPDVYDEPFADSSQIPTLLVSRFARRSVTVALSGDGGDELFGGYLRYLYGQRAWNVIRRIPLPLRQRVVILLDKLTQRLPSQFESAVLRTIDGNAAPGTAHLSKVIRVLGATSPDEIYNRLCALSGESGSVLAGEPKRPRQPSDRPIPARITGAVDRMSYFDLLTYLPDDILTKVDRASMAVGLEVRVPLLDDELVEFCIGLPASLKIRGGNTKFLLRKVLDTYLPRGLMQRPKAGFALPIAEWLVGPLREWCEPLLLMPNDMLDSGHIADLWRQHLDGRGRHHAILWAVLMLNGWLERQRLTSHAEAAVAPTG